MKDTVRSSDGTTIAFDRSGDGPPLVLVGGALSDRSAGASLATHLADRFTVVAYDRRGRGDSGDTPPYAVDREVDDLLALIVDAGGSAFVFGHSSGAALALEAAGGGLPIARLALYEPPFIVDDSRPEVPRDYVTRVEELVAAERRGDAVEYFMTVAVGVPADMVAQMRSSPMWTSMEALAHTIVYDGVVMSDAMAGNPQPLQRWTSVTIPTLVMDGGASPEWQRNSVRALVDVLPNVRHRTLEGQDHGPAEEVLAPVLIEFFTAKE
jgi:pimeloyl-ACP methyl ester carboxylesterase